MSETALPAISLVIPVYNEEESLPRLIEAIDKAIVALPQPVEVVVVDDGSRDRSFDLLEDAARTRPWMRLVRFRRNFGQTAALAAGIDHSRATIIVPFDADLQNDPADIPKLLEKLNTYDMVCGWRQKRNDPWIKRISSWVANTIRNKLSWEDIKDTGCSLKAYRRECLNRIKLFNGMHRFLPTLFKMEGFTVTEIVVNHYPRKFGKSKYGISNRAIRAFIDLLVVRWMKKRKLNYEVEND